MKLLLPGTFVGIGILLVAAFVLLRPVPEKSLGDWERPPVADPRVSMKETIRLRAADGVEIVGDYYPAWGTRGVLLLHMMPADRKSWQELAVKLQQAGFHALAIDLRGHGESRGGPLGYKQFSDVEHQASRLDVEAGAAFLREKGVLDLSLVGASIGANLALEYLVNHLEARAAVLLSPGLDYRGLAIGPFMEKLGPAQTTMLVASEDDIYSFDTVQLLARQAVLSKRRMVKIFKGGGHGTAIFERYPEFVDEVVTWVARLRAEVR